MMEQDMQWNGPGCATSVSDVCFCMSNTWTSEYGWHMICIVSQAFTDRSLQS